MELPAVWARRLTVRLVCACLALAGSVSSLHSQNISLGLMGGADLTPAFQTDFVPSPEGFPGVRFWSQKKDWVAGATVEAGLGRRWAFEIDGLYRTLHLNVASVLRDGSLNSVSPSPVVTWEFPLLLKYRFVAQGFRPFLETGPSFRTTGNLNAHPSRHGFAAGAGIEIPVAGVVVSP